MKRGLGFAAASGLVGAAALANYVTAQYGMVGLPFGAAVTAGTFAAGMVLILRDAVHETMGRAGVLMCIAVGAAVSWATSPAMLALASAVAFGLAELLDWAVYSPLRKRGWKRAVLLSSAVAAPLDTAIFLLLAGFPVTVGAIVGQSVIKTLIALIVVGVGGAVLRNRIVTRYA